MSAYFAIRQPWTLFAGMLFPLVSLFAGTASADNIDDQLLTQMPKLIQACQSKGYSKVGVLTFLYQHGDRPSRFHGATICGNMPSRVENSLALKLKSAQPEFVVLRSASETAAKSLAHASYRSAADRRRLLDLAYTPSWGPATKVKPDAFIVGKVRASQDLRKVTVSLGAFDRESMFDILEFDVPTDRYILADIGQGFSLTKGRVRGVTDDAILDSVETDIDRTDNSSEKVSTAGFPVRLTVFYDHEPQAMRDDSSAEGSNNFSLPEPQEGQSLTFGLQNMTDKPLAAVLCVNGTSTLYEQEGEAADMSKWVLAPGKEYRVRGFHQQGNEKYFEITTLSEEQSKEKYDDLGGSKFAGLIHLHVFKPVDADAAVPEFTRSVGRLSRRDLDRLKFSTLRDLQQAVARKSDIYPPGTRPLAGWGKEQLLSLEEVKLGKVSLTDTMIVRYSSTKPE